MLKLNDIIILNLGDFFYLLIFDLFLVNKVLINYYKDILCFIIIHYVD